MNEDRDKLIKELETEAAMLKASNCSAMQQDRLLRSAQMLREDEAEIKLSRTKCILPWTQPTLGRGVLTICFS